MKTKLSVIFMFILAASSITSCGGNAVAADMVVYGNQIYTANEKGDFARAFAVKDGKYIYVGNEEGANKYIGKNTSIYTSPFVMPSGIEGHAHFLLEQAFMDSCYINPLKDNGDIKKVDEIVNEIKEYGEYNLISLKDHPSLFGYGYNQIYLYTLDGGKLKRTYDRFVLDEGLGEDYKNIPVYIAETSLHEAWVNTLTLTNAGIDLNSGSKDPVVGIDRDSNGVATGVLTNEAVPYILQNGFKNPICSDIGYQKVVKSTCKYLNSMGYTGHYDAWTNFDGTEGIYKALSTIDKAKDLTCLYTGSYNIATFEYKSNSLDDILNKVVDIRNKYKSNHFDPKYIKLFADGVLETGTGYIKQPYTAVYEGTGEQIWLQEDMNKIVEEANRKDLLVHTHTLGDASCSEAVDSFVNSNIKNNKKYRNSLGHCILIDDADYAKIKENEIGVAINAGWLTDNPDGFDLYDTIIGKERASKLYPSDTLLENGIKAAISTDRPCASGPIDIFDYIASTILGYDANEENRVPRREMNISVKDAIDMITINGAWMANYENERGSIEVGKYADFVFADYSPFDCNPKIIKDIDVTSTSFEGQFVYLKTK